MEKQPPKGDIVISYPGFGQMVIRGSVEINPAGDEPAAEAPAED